MHQLQLFTVATLAGVALVLVGCGGSDEKYYIPVDHQIRPFVAPEEDDLVPEADAEELEDEEVEKAPAGQSAAEDEKGSSMPAAGPAPAAAPAPEKAPAKPGKPAKPAKPAKSGKSAKADKPASAAEPGAGSSSR